MEAERLNESRAWWLLNNSMFLLDIQQKSGCSHFLSVCFVFIALYTVSHHLHIN